MAELRARQLTKRFSGIAVVKDVDFAIQPGEIVGYLGPNGSGKTTTAKMLAGLLVPSSGRVEYDGRDIHLDPIAYRHELGYIQEEAFLYPFLSGREYLELIGRLREIPESLLTMKIERFLDLFGILPAADQAIASYSKGMRQKVLITAALLHDPAVILFDEPLTGLDPVGIRRMKDSIVRRAAAGACILVSSHLLHLVEELCHRILILKQGRRVAHGTLAEIQAAAPRLEAEANLEAIFLHVTGDDPAP